MRQEAAFFSHKRAHLVNDSAYIAMATINRLVLAKNTFSLVYQDIYVAKEMSKDASK